MTPELAAISKQYCGAVAVSWYRNNYTLNAIRMLTETGIKTNVHYVLGNNSIDEAIRRLKNNDFPEGINAVVFLLHKPVGQGSQTNVVSFDDERVRTFFELVETVHPFKVGLDSCNVPGAIQFCTKLLPEAMDSCEGGRFSCYISPDMTMVPCSFDQERKYQVSLHDKTIEEAWNSEPFEQFRHHMRNACPNCKKRELCLGGCPLMPEIVFCKNADRTMYRV